MTRCLYPGNDFSPQFGAVFGVMDCLCVLDVRNNRLRRLPLDLSKAEALKVLPQSDCTCCSSSCESRNDVSQNLLRHSRPRISTSSAGVQSDHQLSIVVSPVVADIC